jgi:hypothetical protein
MKICVLSNLRPKIFNLSQNRCHNRDPGTHKIQYRNPGSEKMVRYCMLYCWWLMFCWRPNVRLTIHEGSPDSPYFFLVWDWFTHFFLTQIFVQFLFDLFFLLSKVWTRITFQSRPDSSFHLLATAAIFFMNAIHPGLMSILTIQQTLQFNVLIFLKCCGSHALIRAFKNGTFFKNCKTGIPVLKAVLKFFDQ